MKVTLLIPEAHCLPQTAVWVRPRVNNRPKLFTTTAPKIYQPVALFYIETENMHLFDLMPISHRCLKMYFDEYIVKYCCKKSPAFQEMFSNTMCAYFDPGKKFRCIFKFFISEQCNTSQNRRSACVTNITTLTRSLRDIQTLGLFIYY